MYPTVPEKEKFPYKTMNLGFNMREIGALLPDRPISQVSLGGTDRKTMEVCLERPVRQGKREYE